MKKLIRNILILAWFNSVPIFREPFTLMLLIIISGLPVIFAYVFAGPNLLPYTLIGGMISSIAFIGLVISQDVWNYKHWMKLQDMFVASPVTQLEYSTGLALSAFIISIPGFIFFLLLLIFSRSVNVLSLFLGFVAILLLWSATSSMGFFLGTYIKNPRYLGPFSNLVSLILTFIPPVYYPPELLPHPFRELSMLIPTTLAANILRGAFGLGNSDQLFILINLIGVIIITIPFLILVHKEFQWRER